ncbi:MAG: hypothetical protein WC802_00600 [Patescibacteria group bacterium]|jgi:hypothetical protein
MQPIDVTLKELDGHFDTFASSAIRLGQTIDKEKSQPVDKIWTVIRMIDQILDDKPTTLQERYLGFHRQCYVELAVLAPKTIEEFRDAINTVLDQLRSEITAIKIPEPANV